MDSGPLLGRYTVQESLGSGGGGEVNLAWDNLMQRNVAIKRIKLPMHSSQPMTPGLEEARTAAALQDSRIVSVYDFEVTDTEALLIMEYVDGISLGALMDRIPRKLYLSEVASVVQNLGKALQHAHQHHVLHLDIKPDNVLINTSGQSKVTDFGISKLAMGSMYGSAVGGTIGYMPPEQIRGEEVTAKTDQWAFAVLVYELLTGENPFVAPTFEQSLEKILTSELVLVSSLEEDVDEELDEVLFRAMSIDPDDRYPSVAKFVSALMPYLGDPKKGRTQMGILVETLGDDVLTGSTAERMAAMRKIAFEQQDRPISEEDGEFYDGVDRTQALDPGGEDGRQGPATEVPVLRDSISDRTARTIAHIVGGICCGMLAYLGVSGLPLPSDWSFAGPIAITVMAALGLASPRYGSMASLCLLGAGIICAGYVPHGVVLLSLSMLWWAFCGRGSDAAANCGLLAPCLAPIMLAYMQPVLCGYYLRLRDAMLTSAFGVALMMILFPITGSTELYSLSLAFAEHTTAADLAAYNCYRQAWLWIEAAGWIVSALLMGLLSSRGTKALSLAGAIGSMAIIGISRALGEMASGILRGVFSAEVIAALVLPLLVACMVIWLHDPHGASAQPHATKTDV